MKALVFLLVATAFLMPCAADDPAATSAATGEEYGSSITWVAYNGGAGPVESGVFAEDKSFPGAAAATTSNGDGTVTFELSKDPAARAGLVYAPLVGDAFPKALTFVARIKADPAVARALDVDFRFADLKTPAKGPRIKFIVTNKELQIEKPDGANSSSTVKYKLDTTQFHIYHLTFKVEPAFVEATVYVDGAPDPVMAAKGVALYEENYLWIGDNGGNPCKATVDWMVWTSSGTYAPTDLADALPAEIGDVTGYTK
jgi:hypothetical protein